MSAAAAGFGGRENRRPVKVLHVIGGLELGGAEMVLRNLLARQDRGHFAPTVLSIRGEGPLGSDLRDLGVPVVSLGARTGLSTAPATIARLVRAIRRLRPDVVQTWMYHADLMGGTAARMAGVHHVVWGLHTGPPPPDGPSLSMRVGLAAGAQLSRRVPSCIVCCASEAMRVHRDLGYDAGRMVVIRNGFSVPPEPLPGTGGLRRELGVSGDAFVIGRPGRFHPQKDYETFFTAVGRLGRDRSDVFVIASGPGIDDTNADLRSLVESAGLGGRVRLIGAHPDPAALYGAVDVVVSASAYGEALPLILGEAMAAGLPVVATDVGDSRDLVGDAGLVVPARDPARLAHALGTVAAMPAEGRAALGRRGRERVAAEFSMESMVSAYSDLYEELVEGGSTGTRRNASVPGRHPRRRR